MRERDECNYKQVVFVMMERFCILMVVVVKPIYTYDKIAQNYKYTDMVTKMSVDITIKSE